MSDLSAAIDQATQVLDRLQSLDDKAGGDPGLQGAIQDANTALGTLELADVAADQVKIDALNKQLDTVDQSVTKALADLSTIATVVADVTSLVGIVDDIAKVV